jgi:hypothetical protein
LARALGIEKIGCHLSFLALGEKVSGQGSRDLGKSFANLVQTRSARDFSRCSGHELPVKPFLLAAGGIGNGYSYALMLFERQRF